VARDPEAIQHDIDRARDALATTLDEIGARANPQRLVDVGKQGVADTLNTPMVRYSLIAVGALVALGLLRKLFH
jgi:hypothetical protein